MPSASSGSWARFLTHAFTYSLIHSSNIYEGRLCTWLCPRLWTPGDEEDPEEAPNSRSLQSDKYIYIYFFNLGFTIFWLYDLSKLLTLPETWHSHLENRSCRYGYISCAGAGGCVAKWTVGMMPNFVQLLTVSAFKDRRSSRDHRCEHLWGSLAKSREDVAWRLTKST